jgi:hypothetical protein
MIQLATAPTPGRAAWQPEPKGTPLEARKRHAWPFISRHGEKPAAQEQAKNSNGASGS